MVVSCSPHDIRCGAFKIFNQFFERGAGWSKRRAANFVTIYVNAIGLSLVFIELTPIPKSNNGPLPTMTFPMSAAPPSIYSQH